MPISDIYTFRSGSVAVASTAATPIISVIMPATLRGWVVGGRYFIGNTAAVAGNNLLFQVCRPGNSPTGTGAFNGSAHDASAPAGLAQGYTAWSTAPTVGTVLADWEVPQTSGSGWEEFPPLQYEWQIPAVANGNANAGLHVFVTASVATSTPVFVNLVCSV